MGSGKKVTIGFKYLMGIHMGVSRGPVNELVQIDAGGKTAFSGSVTASVPVVIAQPKLFGGDKKEGGIDGTLHVMMGEPTQTPPAELVSMLGEDVPGFRGVLTMFFDGLVSSMTPYIKPWKMRLRRSTAGWDGEVWYPEKAMIPLAGGNIHAMNAAHIVYESLTNRDWGAGIDRSRFSDSAFRAVADALYAEGFGLCLRWNRQDTVANFVQLVIDHIGASLYQSRFDGLFHLKLIRDDYVAAELPLFDEDTGLLGLDEDENGAASGAVNEVIVKWKDPIKDEDRQTRERNLAAIVSDGQVISTSLEFKGLPTAELAGRVAAREVRLRSSQIKRFKVRLDRRGYRIEPGDVFRIRSTARGIGDLVVRAGRCEDGTLTDAAITITVVQDIFGLPSAQMSSNQPAIWAAPDRSAVPVTVRRVMERTWRDIAATTDPANLNLVDSTAGYVSVLAAKPTSMSIDFGLQTRVGSGDWIDTDAAGDFVPSGVLSAPLSVVDTAFSLSSVIDGDQIEAGAIAVVDDEIVRVDSWDAATMTGTIGRGCLDTVPASHSAGARMFVMEGAATDGLAYGPGTTVEVRVLPNTSQEQLDPVDASVDSIVVSQRQGRPYPPGRLRINGIAYPDTASGVFAVTWAHRDRLLQADQVIDAGVGDIGPEPGVTYVAQLRRVDTGALIDEVTGISSNACELSSIYAGDVTVSVQSFRGGVGSLFSAVAAFESLGSGGAGGVTYRFIRILITATGGSSFPSIGEIELRNGSGVDVTTGLSASCSASSQDGSDGAGRAVEDSDGSEWVANTGSSLPQWWLIDRGTTEPLVSYRLQCQRVLSDRQPTGWVVQGSASDSGPWTDLDTRSGVVGWPALEWREFFF
ncbi:hypothetical protein J5J83_17915 [Azoarcus sp. L1K30]|uniref:phage tail protein n=1 Tax=Azoarcus sp. L1K30 TaxID=2820277 RepID=UPI001B81B87D|nr:phage tail protein [Azoarcus sp. L1K30]MBR0568002.1 hypothetical protein [Azoarcus sp. L1K30]